jgi:hypothetical protein
VTLGLGGDIGGCDNWKYQLVDPQGQTCPTQVAGSGSTSVVLAVNCNTAVDGTWTVHVSWDDLRDKTSPSQDVSVGGKPPSA